MNRNRGSAGLVGVAVRLCLRTSAASKPTEVLKPYLDVHTCFVIEIDLTRTKPDDVSKWVGSILQESKIEKADAAQKAIVGDMLPKAQKMVDDLRKAGAKHVYWVASIADMRNDPFFMVIPLEGNAQEEKILKLLPNNDIHKSEKIENAIISAPAQTVERLKNVEPADQPELAKAFQVIGDAPIRAAIVVIPEVRTIMQQPPIPQPKQLFDHLNWIGAALALPPHPRLNVIGQAEDNDSAEKAATAANELLAMAKDNPEMDKFEALKAQLEETKLEAKENQVVLAVDAARMKTITEALAPALVMARMQAMRVKSASNERQLLQGLLMYANDNNGAYPADLDTVIKKYMENNTEVAVNPAATGDDDGYVYIKPPEGSSAPADRLVIYESFDDFPEEGINVGFGDGHVEFVTSEDSFNQMLKDAKEAAEKK
jgi:prepilin-type processing-associated H-X9-DG protein